MTKLVNPLNRGMVQTFVRTSVTKLVHTHSPEQVLIHLSEDVASWCCMMSSWLWQDIPSLIRSGSVPTLSTLDTGHMGPAHHNPASLQPVLIAICVCILDIYYYVSLAFLVRMKPNKYMQRRYPAPAPIFYILCLYYIFSTIYQSLVK